MAIEDLGRKIRNVPRTEKHQAVSPPFPNAVGIGFGKAGTTFIADVLGNREHRGGLKITIGSENPEEALSDFTLVTAEYRVGQLKGVIGVIGPTRMPYEKVMAIVDYTSTLVNNVLGA